ncbi:MAG TPA: ABC transporter permease [Candidatus Mediterraneibacter guildfordensis]|nr:ABC transporter permease [Candidatus Mediterraneibacter guildfordensis]
MARYTCRRILTGFLSLFVLITVTFFLVRIIPGSPFQRGGVSESVVEAIEQEYGLNEPLFTQYISYIGGVLHGDLGISYQDPAVRVTEVIARAWPVTASVGTAALIVSLIMGTGLGILSAVSGRRSVKQVISAGGMIAAGIPGFAAAILLMLVFSVKLKLLPASGLLSPVHYILPVAALSLYPSAMVSRLVSSTLETELTKDYVLFARAKGLGRRQVIFTHALKNAYLPVINYIGPASASLLTGSFVVESIFTIPGLGREFVGSITNRDYTLILGLTVFMGAVVILVNLITDLLCAWLDPKTRRAYREERA